VVPRRTPIMRFRRNSAAAVAAIIALIGAIPLAAQGWAYALVLLVPLAVVLWAWRSGTDVRKDGLVVRALLGSRYVPWSEVTALVPHGGTVHAQLTNGNRLPLALVRPADLPRVVEFAQYEPVTTLSNGSPAE
jgi:hypothetical protein